MPKRHAKNVSSPITGSPQIDVKSGLKEDGSQKKVYPLKARYIYIDIYIYAPSFLPEVETLGFRVRKLTTIREFTKCGIL